MTRKPAMGRVRASGRALATGRQPIGFLDDGKIHIVLDTNVLLYAIWALAKKEHATQTEKDSLSIICILRTGAIVNAVNGMLFTEYEKKAAQHLKTGKIHPSDVSYVLGQVKDNSIGVRVRINPQRFSPDKDDDMLFDGLSAHFLVSNNLKDVAPHRLLPGVISSHTETLSSTDFLKRINDLK